MKTLYFAPRTRATRIRWLLEEMELPYELLNKAPSEHPVPTLIDGDLILENSSAICFYLADQVPDNLAPKPGTPERALYYEWILFAENRLEAAVLASDKSVLPKLLDKVDAFLAGRDYFVCGKFTALDIVMASILHLASHMKLLDEHPRLIKYVQLHTQRPAVRKAVST